MGTFHQELMPKCSLQKHLTLGFTGSYFMPTAEMFKGILRLPGVNVKQVVSEKSMCACWITLGKMEVNKKALWCLISVLSLLSVGLCIIFS